MAQMSQMLEISSWTFGTLKNPYAIITKVMRENSNRKNYNQVNGNENNQLIESFFETNEKTRLKKCVWSDPLLLATAWNLKRWNISTTRRAKMADFPWWMIVVFNVIFKGIRMKNADCWCWILESKSNGWIYSDSTFSANISTRSPSDK